MPLANIVDYGAVPGGIGSSAVNAQAFRNALGTGARRILIPEGSWWFNEILFNTNQYLPLGVEIFGEGVNATILHYNPTNDAIPAFKAWPTPAGTTQYARSSFHDFTILGRVTPAINIPPVGIGIDLDNALFCRVVDVQVWEFDIGVRFNSGVASTDSGYNVLERFEINSCRTGILMGNATNADTVQNGRVWNSLVLYDATGSGGGARQEGFGILVQGASGAGGPSGGQGVLISGVAVERSEVCLFVRLSRDTTVIGCYFEPGDTPPGGPGTEYPQYAAGSYPFGRERRRCLDIDSASERVHFVGTLTSEPSNPAGETTWTPTYAPVAPETRTELQYSSFPASGGSFAINAYGAALHGATAAYANRIKNADMSRGTWQWPTTNMGSGTQMVDATSYVISGQSLRLTVGDNVQFYMSQNVVLNSGLRSVTVAVRYRLLSAAPNAFRFALYEGATRLGFFSDVDAGGGASPWKTRALTGRFDGLAGGVTGPRTLQVRIYPYNDSIGAAGQQVLVDSIWLVDGEYAPPYRPYTEGIEILRGDDREEFFTGTNVTAPVGPTALLPSRVPRNAVGMIVEMRIQAQLASTTFSMLRVDDNEGAVGSQTRDLVALANDRYSMCDYLLPITPGGTLPEWSILGATGSNRITYRVRVKAWILRM